MPYKILAGHRKCKLKLNIEKPHYKTKLTSFFGTTFSSDSHKQENEKFKQLMICHNQQMSSSVVGKVLYIWGPGYTEAYGVIKKEITSTPVLNNYDSKYQSLCTEMWAWEVLVQHFSKND